MIEEEINVIEETPEDIINIEDEAEDTIELQEENVVIGGSSVIVLPYQESYNVKDLDDGIYELTPDEQNGFPNLVIYQSNTEQTVGFGGGYLFVNKSTIGEITYIAYQFNTLQESGSTSDIEIVAGGILVDGDDAQGFYSLIQKTPTELSQLNGDSTHRVVTDTQIETWSNKADYGFYGIIDGTSANPTDGSTLANGTYIADPSKASSYINLPMEDGTTKKQTIQKGGIVIRTAGRLIVLATQNLMYQYNTSEQYFYEPESLVESYVRVESSDKYADIGTLSPPNNKIVVGDIYSIEGVINTGDVGHARLIFKVVDDLEGEPFEYNVTASDGEEILYEDGAVPEFKQGMTYILEFYGHNCEIIGYKEAGTLTKDGLLRQFMRQNSNQIYYPSVDGLPVITVTKAVFDSSTRNISIGESQDILIDGIHTLDYYNIPKYINLDLSPYDTVATANQLHPETQLPDGVYYVTRDGKINFSGDIYNSIAGEIIFKKNNEMAVCGIYGAVYYSYDTSTQEWTGGFFTTQADVENILADINPMKDYKISKSTTATGNISLVDGRWTKKSRTSGINSGSCSTPNTLTEVPDTYRSRFTLKTSSSFTTFTVTQPANFSIYMVGDDCANGTITMVANKYYDVQLEADGFGDIIGHVYSYTLPTT